ncbi:MAG: hydroxymethylbilane synthase [Candidatus Bathyarchaeum tardum]|nr:MAG: hydroxymethylbilane synthase [Candidatus Bathyarchaeum tardum]
MILTVGTRGSKLSLMQTNTVLKRLHSLNPHVQFDVKIIKTLGDKDQSQSLFSLDRKGIFEKEIDQAIEKGEVDFAVHSLKDVPILEHSQTMIVAIPERNSPHDVLISKNKLSFAELPEGAVIGTSSLRRMAQVKYLRPDLQIKPIRGNVDTRIKKVNNGDFDAIVVAEAGLNRLGLENKITERFSLDQFSPSAGQGALALAVKQDNESVIRVLESVDHVPSHAEITAERNLVLALEGGCRVPIGTIGRANGDQLLFSACVFSLDGQKKIFSSAKGSLADAQDLGKKVAQDLIAKGAKKFEAEWREKYGTW